MEGTIMNGSWARRASIFAVVAAGILGGTATSASAAGEDIDPVHVNTVRVDFRGNVTWSTGSSRVKARVEGTVYYDDSSRAGCARVRLSMYDFNGNRVTPDQFSQEACGQPLLFPIDSNVEKELSAPASSRPHRLKLTAQVGSSVGEDSYRDTGTSVNVVVGD